VARKQRPAASPPGLPASRRNALRRHYEHGCAVPNEANSGRSFKFEVAGVKWREAVQTKPIGSRGLSCQTKPMRPKGMLYKRSQSGGGKTPGIPAFQSRPIVRNKPNPGWGENEGKCFMAKGLRATRAARGFGKTKPIRGCRGGQRPHRTSAARPSQCPEYGCIEGANRVATAGPKVLAMVLRTGNPPSPSCEDFA
jgi:hypothetical protein